MKPSSHAVLRAGYILVFSLAALVFACPPLGYPVAAQSVSTTTVQGVVYLANGQPGSGTLQISWPAFTTSNSLAVAAGRTTLTIGADGFVSVNLTPNLGASPAGLFYTAVYHMSDGTTSTEYWIVPAAAQAPLASVRAQVMPAAQAVQAVSKAYVDQAVQSLAQGTLTPVGGTLSEPLYLSGDPTQSLQAADKHYVDASFAQALPLSGGAATGPLTATQLGGAYQVDQFPGSDFGAQLQACLSGLNTTYGGTCDARNFSGNLSMAANVTVSTANATVLLPCATITTGSEIIISAGTRNVSLHGCSLRGSSNASGTQGGTVFVYTGAASMIQVGDPTYASDTQGFHLDNAVLSTVSATTATAQAFVAYRTQELDVQSLYLLGNSNQTGMTLDGTGNYTGGTFYDIAANGFLTAVNAIGHQVANVATTDWLNASSFVRLHINCPTSSGNPIAGTTGINLAQGDGNTFTGGDVEGCSTALHLGANAQNNTVVGLRNENSSSQVVADAGSSYNNWITGGTMFTGKLTDNGTRNSFLDTFHRSFNGMTGDWYGSQQDATVTNHYRLGIGSGNERGLYSRYQTDDGYRWTTGLSDATAGEQFYQVLDELNNVYRLSIGQYNSGQSSTNNQTVINAAGTGAVVLNGSNNSGTGGVVIGSGGPSETTVATINNVGNAQFVGSLQVGGPSTFTSSTTVRNAADAEIDSILQAGITVEQKESFVYRDHTGASQWFMVKDQNNNWALNSATGNIDSIKAYQNTNSGDTYINAQNSGGVVRVNYETGSGTQFKVYGGNSSTPYASFTGTTAIQFPGLAATSGHNCLQVDNSGYLTNTGSACGSGSSNGIVNSGSAGQIAYYSAAGAAVSGVSAVPVAAGGTGATTAAAALSALGAASLAASATQNFAGPVAAPAVNASINSQINVAAAPYNARGDCATDDSAAIQSAINAAGSFNPPAVVYFPKPAGGCYLTSTLAWNGASLQGQPSLGVTPASGSAGVILRGKPGQDILHIADPTAAGSTAPATSWSIRDLVFQVDDSIDASATFAHRWPGRWFNDAAIIAGSAVFTSTNASISCGDVGQNILVKGAGPSGGDLATTINSVSPCTGHRARTITLAAAASTAVSSGAAYITPLGIPLTATIGNCSIAMDNRDGNPADWMMTGSPAGTNDTLWNTTFTSVSGNAQNNSCSIYTQGVWGPYAIDARNVTIARTVWGIVQGAPETNSWYQSDSGDFELWDHGNWNLVTYPWISYNGGSNSLKHIQLATTYGPQLLSLGNKWGDSLFGLTINAPQFELNTGGIGWRIEGRQNLIENTALSGDSSTAIIDADDTVCNNCSAFGHLVVNGMQNDIRLGGDISTSTMEVADHGFGNSITGAYNSNPQGSADTTRYAALNITRGPLPAGIQTADFIRTGNVATPYFNDLDLFFWPNDFINGADAETIVNDASSLTGSYYPWGNGYEISNFANLALVDGRTANSGTALLISSSTSGGNVPATNLLAYASVKCASASNVEFDLYAGSTQIASATPACSTGYSTISLPANLAAYAGQNLGFRFYSGSGKPMVGWIALRPFQSDYNGYQPARSGVNGDIVSLTGLTTPLSTAQGGTGTGVLTGYRYANGNGPDTASTTIPATALSNGTTGSGNIVLANGPTFKGNTTTFANATGAEQDVIVQPGSTADQIGAFALANYSGVTQWKLRKDASNYLRFTDSVNSLDRGIFYQNGQTIFNAGAGANAVVVNGTTNSGTGGLLVQNGGSSPATVLTVTGSGNTTATGFIAGKAITGSGSMTTAAGSAAGTSPSLACSASHLCDSVSGTLTLTTGSSPTTGTLATLTFPSARTNSANCIVNASSSTGQLTSITWSETASALTLTANSSLSASTAYQIRYWCGGN
ncbi:MAG TPA: glycosyl hydrolase family 28-related protein [Terracidiphilus sp.]|nr:glycosyl hydrolase family 28-related protein [Terracidiphilus sp.]